MAFEYTDPEMKQCPGFKVYYRKGQGVVSNKHMLFIQNDVVQFDTVYMLDYDTEKETITLVYECSGIYKKFFGAPENETGVCLLKCYEWLRSQLISDDTTTNAFRYRAPEMEKCPTADNIYYRKADVSSLYKHLLFVGYSCIPISHVFKLLFTNDTGTIELWYTESYYTSGVKKYVIKENHNNPLLEEYEWLRRRLTTENTTPSKLPKESNAQSLPPESETRPVSPSPLLEADTLA